VSGIRIWSSAVINFTRNKERDKSVPEAIALRAKVIGFFLATKTNLFDAEQMPDDVTSLGMLLMEDEGENTRSPSAYMRPNNIMLVFPLFIKIKLCLFNRQLTSTIKRVPMFAS
jgi:hypothetical protein